MSNDSDRLVEAAIFIAGRPVSVKEIQELQEMDQRTIRSALNRLQKAYSADDRAIELVKIGSKYAMQVKEQFRPEAEILAMPELSKETLKVASLIGYYQPILQSKLAGLAGPHIYAGVKELIDHGLVRAKPKGRSLELTTTTKFIEYFGIDARTRDEVKSWFKRKLRGDSSKD